MATNGNGENVPGVLTTEEIERFLRYHESEGAPAVLRVVNWFARTEYAARQLFTNPDPDSLVLAAYWTHLGGCIKDLHERYSSLDVSRADEFTQELVTKFADALDTLRNSLTEDQRLYVELQRHTHAHPILDRWALEVKKTGLRAQVKPYALGRQIDMEDVLQRCRNLEDAAGGVVYLARQIAQTSMVPLANAKLTFEPIGQGLLARLRR